MARQIRPRRIKAVRHYDAQGKRCAAGDAAETRVEESRTWYAKIDGVTVSLGTTDEGEAWQELRRRLKRRGDEADGVYHPVLDAAKRPLAEHVEEWLAVLTAKGTGGMRVAELRQRVTALATEAKWERIGHVTADSCALALARLAKRDDLSAQTRNHYLSAAKQFCRWLTMPPARLTVHPLLGMAPANVDADRRHERRCPTDDEVSKLFAWLESDRADTDARGRKWTMNEEGAPVRHRMTGRQRALGYKVAMAAGLRGGELRSLSRESFDLDKGTVTVRAAYDKRRRPVTQPLPDWLVSQLREWFAAGGRCWERLPEYHSAKILRYDLERAGVEYVVAGPDGPLFFDLHALRVWYVTQLANQPGISPKVLMTLARHSTPELSLKVYGKARQEETRAAAKAVPDPSRDQSKG